MVNIRMLAAMGILWMAASLEAKTLKKSLTWPALPADLVGRNVKVEVAKRRRESGVVEKVDAAGITLQHRKGSRLIPRTDVSSIEWTTRKRPRWSIAGAAVGAAPGIFVTAVAVSLDRNEGGIYGRRNITIAALILAGGAVVGALGGYATDVDRHVITITGP